jgi:hypothetical protein
MARGATPQQADIGAAVAEAESGGRTEAHGDLSLPQGQGQYPGSLGPWQIYGKAHPGVSAACAQDPGCAADQAKAISSGFTNWNPWTTFKTGAYRQFLASPADFVPPGSVPSAGGPGATLLSASPGSAPGWAQDLGVPDLGGLFLRGGLTVVGIILILVGLITMFRAGPAIRYYGTRAAMGAALG